MGKGRRGEVVGVPERSSRSKERNCERKYWLVVVIGSCLKISSLKSRVQVGLGRVTLCLNCIWKSVTIWLQNNSLSRFQESSPPPATSHTDSTSEWILKDFVVAQSIMSRWNKKNEKSERGKFIPIFYFNIFFSFAFLLSTSFRSFSLGLWIKIFSYSFHIRHPTPPGHPRSIFFHLTVVVVERNSLEMSEMGKRKRSKQDRSFNGKQMNAPLIRVTSMYERKSRGYWHEISR